MPGAAVGRRAAADAERDRRGCPASRTARRTSPVPCVVAPSGVALRGREPRQPGRLASSTNARAPSSAGEPAGADRPAERVVRLGVAPLPAAGRLDRDERALAAVGERREQDLVVGRAARQPSASALATSTRVSEPLNESGAMSDAQRGRLSRPGSRRARLRALSRYSGMRTIGGRSWSASSMTSSESRPAAGARQLHRRAELGEQARLAPLLEPLHDRLEDHERHPRQALELLVAVDPPLEVDLAEAVEPGPLGDVDEVPDLDRVAGEERDLLEQRAPARVLARRAAGCSPDSSGKNRLISGRATSSVTRPPPPSLSTPPSTIGRW